MNRVGLVAAIVTGALIVGVASGRGGRSSSLPVVDGAIVSVGMVTVPPAAPPLPREPAFSARQAIVAVRALLAGDQDPSAVDLRIQRVPLPAGARVSALDRQVRRASWLLVGAGRVYLVDIEVGTVTWTPAAAVLVNGTQPVLHPVDRVMTGP